MAKAIEFENPMFEDDYADGETTGAGDVAADVADDVVAEIAAEVAGDIIAAKKVDPLRVNPTGIGDGSVVGDEGLFQAQRVLASAVNDYYKNLASDQGLSPELPDINQFVLVDNRLRLKNYPDINLTNARTGRPNTLGYIAGHWKGGERQSDRIWVSRIGAQSCQLLRLRPSAEPTRSWARRRRTQTMSGFKIWGRS
ncbi:hypothetical protein RRG08_057963 [Elysia crispata]|uniref:Uncharacterized protein n=1 Tax=Elysia crispata TaxID=231223 RepID=A0AAE1BDE8_9GAST|nr:hypothetical protein RRG08_057963 [Elysia crispata]